jgi:zinc D-Ala-D-Ala carboxypeptidase
MDPRALVTPHFAWAEMLRTDHRDPAILREQANPPQAIQANVASFCQDLLEPVRELTGRLRINSGYRCPALNAAIGGARTSAHMAGRAADVVPLELGLVEAYERIAGAGLPALDQIILEYGAWVHLGASFSERAPRHQLLMIWEPGIYLPWDPSDARVVGLREGSSSHGR